MERSSVYWDNVLAPALRDGKTVLVVGHENNLRSLIMRLEGINEQDILHLSLPRAVPLAYRLDANLRPINARKDESLDEATGFLRGEWLGGDGAVADILSRDETQVYDTTVTENLEIGAASVSSSSSSATTTTTTTTTKKHQWLDVCLPEPSPEAKAKGDEAAGSFLGSAPVNCSSLREPSSSNCVVDVSGASRRAAAA